jgi:hypothetical protein
MTIENLQDENEQAPIPQTIEDIEFDLVTEDDPEFETALSVINTNGEKSPEELVEDAKKEVVRTSWWLQEYWLKKGMPKEQITVQADNLTIEMYNYGQALSPSQLEEARRVIATLSQASIPNQNSRKYVAINDTDEMNDQNGENKRGYAFPASRMVALYPRAVSPEPHRIADTSSFAGTLAHEFGHIYLSVGGDFWNEWRKSFGWETLPDNQVDWKKPAPKSYATNQSERCITDYAQFSPDEDICESLSAVVNNPAVLDPERRAFIMERWFKDEPVKKEVATDRKVAGQIKMPRVPDKIKYKAKVMGFRVGTITKGPSTQTE